MNIEASMLIVIAIFLPLVAAAALNIFSAKEKLRDFIGMGFAAAQIFIIYQIATKFLNGESIKASFFEILPNIKITFEVESLGLVYAIVASCLWLVTLIFAYGYMRANQHKNLLRFYVFFAIAIACSMGIAFSDNLLTMFIFYEALTFSTYPLVTHNGDEASKKSGRTYLGILVGGSVVLFLPAIIWTNSLTGNIGFEAGGVFDGAEISDKAFAILLLMFAFGIGKAALMPLHKWLPAAMVAPTPVSALLHAVAVVKAGVFCIAKIIFYILGTEKLASIGGADWLSYIAAFTIITASIIALRQDNLKLRLAYSTIAQLSYIVLAAAIFNVAGMIAVAAHIVSHAVGKITLFFSAGAIATSTGKKYISELDGIGRKMPIIGIAFLIASLSMIGIPFLAGGESKHFITEAAKGKEWVSSVLYASMALNAAYYLPISYRLFFKKAKVKMLIATPKTMQLAICITALLTASYVFYIDNILKIMELL